VTHIVTSSYGRYYFLFSIYGGNHNLQNHHTGDLVEHTGLCSLDVLRSPRNVLDRQWDFFSWWNNMEVRMKGMSCGRSNNRELIFRWRGPYPGDLWVLSVNITTGNRKTVSCKGSYVLQTDFQPLKMSIKFCGIYRLWRGERERKSLYCGGDGGRRK
jgi:hypothetical protein